jgi:drug/metabolite transporter (DMT)-like permease
MTETVRSGGAAREKNRAPLCMLAAAVLFSLGGMLFKLVPWNSMAISCARSTLAGIMLFVYMKLRGHRIVMNRAVLLGGFAMGATSTLYAVAAKLTTAANAILLQYTAPVFIILLMWIFFRVKPAWLDIGATAVLLCGIVLFFASSLSGGGGTVAGNILALISGVTWAMVFMMKQWKGADNLSSVFFGCVFCIVIGLPWLFAQDVVWTAPAIGGILLIGLIQFGAAYVFMAEGLEGTPPLAASLISMLEPILNPIWVALTVGEVPCGLSLAGAIIVVLGVLVYNLLKARAEKGPAREDAAEDAGR